MTCFSAFFLSLSAVQPVPMPAKEQTFSGSARVSGWGYTSNVGGVSRTLMAVTVHIIDDQSTDKMPSMV